ncbi:MAG TPA: NAD(P)-binding domain-containing protein [candidate division Zixibacteria bacterium]|nr:NAD(P)-binding domain-containing protein [candidate division Zixibacteria bacterium]
MSDQQSFDLIIIGAGPAGLETALAASDAGLNWLVLERGAVANNIRDWGFLELFSPWKYNTSERGRALTGLQSVNPGEVTTGAEYVARYLEPLANSPALKDYIQEQTRVLSVGRDRAFKNSLIGDSARAELPFVVLAESADGEKQFFARCVVDASGVYGNHRWLGSGGIPCPGERAAADRISYTLEDVSAQGARFDGRKVAVVGAGYSACSMLERLKELRESGCDVTVEWLVSQLTDTPVAVASNDPLPYRKRLGELANALTKERYWVSYRPGVAVRSLKAADSTGRVTVTLTTDNGDETLEVDHIYAMVGYTPDNSLYRELQVHECWATSGPMKLAATLLSQSGADCLNIDTGGPDTLRNPEPGFFIIGAKSYGRNSQFLIERLNDQVPAVLTFVRKLLFEYDRRA